MQVDDAASPPASRLARFEDHPRLLPPGFLLALVAVAIPAGLAVAARRRSISSRPAALGV
jgi:hypothetical protein